MRLHVRAKVGPVGEALLADRAQVGLLPCVGPQVALKQPRSRESLAADIALVVEIVGEDVHGEGRHGDVHLAADVALLGAPRIQTPVGLLVPGQIRTGGVVLSALGAGVLRLEVLLADRYAAVLALLGPAVDDRQREVGGHDVHPRIVVVVAVRQSLRRRRLRSDVRRKHSRIGRMIRRSQRVLGVVAVEVAVPGHLVLKRSRRRDVDQGIVLKVTSFNES